MYTSKVGRKKKSPDELMVNINTKVPPDVYKEVESIAAAQDRLISYVGRKLILRGLIFCF